MKRDYFCELRGDLLITTDLRFVLDLKLLSSSVKFENYSNLSCTWFTQVQHKLSWLDCKEWVCWLNPYNIGIIKRYTLAKLVKFKMGKQFFHREVVKTFTWALVKSIYSDRWDLFLKIGRKLVDWTLPKSDINLFSELNTSNCCCLKVIDMRLAARSLRHVCHQKVVLDFDNSILSNRVSLLVLNEYDSFNRA